MDYIALEQSADLNKRVSFDGGLLHWLRVTRPAAPAFPGYSSIMARIPTHWITWETSHRIKRTDIGGDGLRYTQQRARVTWKSCSCCPATAVVLTRDGNVASRSMSGTPPACGGLTEARRVSACSDRSGRDALQDSQTSRPKSIRLRRLFRHCKSQRRHRILRACRGVRQMREMI